MVGMPIPKPTDKAMMSPVLRPERTLGVELDEGDLGPLSLPLVLSPVLEL